MRLREISKLGGGNLETNRKYRQNIFLALENNPGEGIDYPCFRDQEHLECMHGVDFDEKIKTLIKKHPERKVKILDVGGGLSVFANQLRKKFPEQVRVYTTSLSKRSIKQSRDHILENGFPYEVPDSVKDHLGDKVKLHQDDAVTQSVYEMRDFEEFDLIIDTFGQFYYDNDLEGTFGYDLDKNKILNYLRSVIKKLRKGGEARIFGIPRVSWLDEEENRLWDECVEAINKELVEDGAVDLVDSADSEKEFKIIVIKKFD